MRNRFLKIKEWIKSNNKDYGKGWMTLIKSVFKKENYVIPEDKANHIIYGLLVFTALYYASDYLLLSLTGSLIIGVLNEVNDWNKGGKFDPWDIVATIVLPLVITLIYI